jgi:hypothetical protein
LHDLSAVTASFVGDITPEMPQFSAFGEFLIYGTDTALSSRLA